jgi:hypothetical protein
MRQATKTASVPKDCHSNFSLRIPQCGLSQRWNRVYTRFDDQPNVRNSNVARRKKETSNQKGRSYDPGARVTRWLLVFLKLPDLRIEINTVSTRGYE